MPSLAEDCTGDDATTCREFTACVPTGIKGGMFITPHAVQRYRERFAPRCSYEQARDELIEIVAGGKFVGPYTGMKPLHPLEMWRGPRIGPHSRQDRRSRLRFVVGRAFDGAPQVVTVLGCTR